MAEVARSMTPLPTDPGTLNAIYYPHTTPREVDFLKSALLLWDRVRVIVPGGWYKSDLDGARREAAALVLDEYEPTVMQKQEVHARIAELAKKPLPEWMIFEPTTRDYPVYAEKLQHDTWQMLRELGMAVRAGEHSMTGYRDEYVLRPSAGLTVMSALADVCGGAQFEPITDSVDALSAWTRYATWTESGVFETETTKRRLPPPIPGEHLLVSRNLLGWRLGSVPIQKVIALREKYEKDLRDVRRSFARETRKYAERLRTQVRTEADVESIEREYRDALRRDLSDLADELGGGGVDELLGEGGLVGAGLEILENPTPVGIVKGVLGVGRRLMGRVHRRKAVVAKHWTSLLYLTSKHGPPMRGPT